MPRLIKATNGETLGVKIGRFRVVRGSQGGAKIYRSGYFIHFGYRTLGFIPTTGYRSLDHA